MAIDRNKHIDLNALDVIRDWANEKFLQQSEASKMMGSRIKITFEAEFIGQTYTVSGGAEEQYTGTVPEVPIVVVNVKEQNSVYTISCRSSQGFDYEREVEIKNYFGEYLFDFNTFVAYIDVTADPNAEIKAVSLANVKTYTGKADGEGKCTIAVSEADTYMVTAELNGDVSDSVKVVVKATGETYPCVLPTLLLEIVGWAEGTDKQITKILDAAKLGAIDLQADCGWNVGDTRTVHISQFIASGNVQIIEQDVPLVITSFEDYNGCGCKMQFDFKHCLTKGVRMNFENTNVGGYKESEMHTVTIPLIVKALPKWLSDRLTEFSVKVGEGNRQDIIEEVSGCKLALRSEMEVFGTHQYSANGEGTHIPYYASKTQRTKNMGDASSSNAWWLRSPYLSGATGFCNVNNSGTVTSNVATTASGVAPFGCI